MHFNIEGGMFGGKKNHEIRRAVISCHQSAIYLIWIRNKKKQNKKIWGLCPAHITEFSNKGYSYKMHATDSYVGNSYLKLRLN